jgi:ElaB/YqjD/DUF883 family membrane-anchored ribosome-binding protein
MRLEKHRSLNGSASLANQFTRTAEKVGEVVMENVKKGINDSSVSTLRYTKKHPLTAVGISFVTGALLSLWLLHR